MNSILDLVQNPANAPLISTVRKFSVNAFPPGFLDDNPDASMWVVDIEYRGENSWAVVHHGEVYDKNFVGEYEPLPSSRTKKFKKRFRHDLPTAVDIAEELARTVTMMGMDWEGFMKWSEAKDAEKAAKAAAE